VPVGDEESHDVEQSKFDPEKVLEQLRAEHKVLAWEPLPPAKMRQYADGSQVRNRAALEYLHHHWALPDTFDQGAAGGGAKGKVVGLFGRLTYRVLGPYMREERELLSHVVRVSEALEQRCDELILRCEQLNQDMVDRQAAEAENQAKLALWLNLEPPASAAVDRSGDGDRAPSA
jgi:hypothetical protein